MTYNAMPYGSGSDTWTAALEWKVGDRVVHLDGARGTVANPPRERNASEVHALWVDWDDGTGTFCEPAVLDVVE